jgi:hypothetical protein
MVARHLITLAALISGIVGSKSAQLPHIAAKVPNGTKPESRVKRFARWCDNAHILEEVYFLPYADVLLRHLALQTVVLVMLKGCTKTAFDPLRAASHLAAQASCARESLP